MTRPNSVTTNYTYDNLSRLTSVLHQLSGSTIDGASYTLDSAGNRTAKTDLLASSTSSYTYDPIYQLTQVTQANNTTESYSYDAVGNRTASLGVSSYTTNASNELTATSNASYTYDSNGNMLTKTVGSNATSYSWDYENRLTSVTLPGSGATVMFKYDPFGRRIYKSSSVGTSIFAYDNNDPIEKTDTSGAAVASYTQTQTVDEPLAMLSGGATSYYEVDGLGSVTSLTSAVGALAETYTFDSFGKQTASSGSLTNPFSYAAREFDTETGLDYYRARYYDPTTGRFLSEDHIRFNGGFNFYPYAANNPANLTDPFGLCPQLSKCARRILEAVNNQFGTNFTAANVTDLGVNPNGGEYVIDIQASSATGLTASQFNATQPGRYTSFTGLLTGLEPSLHVGPSPLDSTAGSFQSSNVGGFLSLDFTAHTDSGFPYNPIGAIKHLFSDVLGHKTRKPCP